jgi:hypothetical protein
MELTGKAHNAISLALSLEGNFNERGLEIRTLLRLCPASRPPLAFFDFVDVVIPVGGVSHFVSLPREKFFLAVGKLFDEFVRNAVKSEKLGHGHDLGGAFHSQSAHTGLVDSLANGHDAMAFDHHGDRLVKSAGQVGSFGLI